VTHRLLSSIPKTLEMVVSGFDLPKSSTDVSEDCTPHPSLRSGEPRSPPRRILPVIYWCPVASSVTSQSGVARYSGSGWSAWRRGCGVDLDPQHGKSCERNSYFSSRFTRLRML
jgi:hypothetical protein